MNDLPKHMRCKTGQHQKNIMESTAYNFHELVRTYQVISLFLYTKKEQFMSNTAPYGTSNYK